MENNVSQDMFHLVFLFRLPTDLPLLKKMLILFKEVRLYNLLENMSK